MTTVLKLGGSVLTHKDTPETIDTDALARSAEAIAGASDPDRLVVAHGGGSFGHYHADRHGVTRTDGTRDATALAAIHAAMGDLNDAVVDALHERDVDALPVGPLSVAYRTERDGELCLSSGVVETMLGEGFVPVLHGDVVAHGGTGGTILSGDEIVVSLARSLEADRVGLCSTVPGVLDADGKVVARVDSFDDVADALGASGSTDVTGGMAAKVRTLLDLPTPSHVFGLADLPAFLAGESPGTVVGAETDCS